MFQASINSSQLELLPMKAFEGETIVVDSPTKVKEAVDDLSAAVVVGFDTETRPSFVKGLKHTVALLQLSTENKAYLFRLKAIGLPAELIQFMEDGSTLKVGAAIRDDLRALQKIHPFLPLGFIDLQAIVKKYGITDLSVRKLAGIVLKIRISKSQQLSNWENNPLSEPQKRYAATDAWVCREVYNTLQKSI